MSEITPQTIQEVGFKVFVGNLSFNTTDEDLKSAFGALGEITSAQVINRGSRSLGYGFICYLNEADATKAVSTLNHSEIAGRQVNVELAKPAAAPRAPREPREPKVPAAPRAPREVAAPQVGEDGEVVAPKPKKRSSRAKKAANAARQPRTDGETEEVGDAPVAAETAPVVRGGRPPRSTVAPIRRGPPTGEPSKTLLFVANLPFSVDDVKLSALFSESGLKVVSARVIVKKYGASEGRSKGFGFVDFENEEDQKKALSTVQGKEVEGRAIELKVAVANAEGEGPPPTEAKEAEAIIVAS